MAKLHTSFIGPPTSVSKLDQDLDRYISDSSNENYDELLKTEDTWPVFYNLTDLRAALLSWYDIAPNAEVMAMGAGIGSLTGLLCEKAGRVAVVEQSMFRARTIAKRYNETENLDIYVGELTDLHIVKKFDLIIAIDILPRIADGSQSPVPYIKYLEELRSYLTLDGKILLAMDNRFGLKYFCGARNPYTEEPFGELSGAQPIGHLFSREEISFIVKEAGFPYVKFYYPLPDFRLPTVVYTDNILPGNDIGDKFFPYDHASDTRVLQESELYLDIIDNGAFPFMANSFLIECSREDNLCTVDQATIASDRGRKESVVTSISAETGTVIKQPVFKAAKDTLALQAGYLDALRERGLDVIDAKLDDGKLLMPYYPAAPKLSDWFAQTLPKDKDRVLSVFDRLWAAILQSSPPAPDKDNVLLKKLGSSFDWGVILKRAYVGMVPSNILYMDSRLVFLNQEYVRTNYPAKYPMFRAVYYSYSDLENVVSLEELKTRYGLDSVWTLFMAEEQEFIASIRHYDVYHQLYAWGNMDDNRMVKNRQILKIIGNE